MIGGALLGKFGAVLWQILRISIPVPLVAIAAAWAWMHFDKSSEIRTAVDHAVENLVHSAEKDTLAARLAEEHRQRQAAELALAGFTRALSEADARHDAETLIREQEIADHEKQLALTGRSCVLDDDDIDWLRRP